jgi:hypothetical protein
MIWLMKRIHEITSDYVCHHRDAQTLDPSNKMLIEDAQSPIARTYYGTFRLVPKSVVSKSGFRNAAPLSGPSLGT